jgi:hypothetical protein
MAASSGARLLFGNSARRWLGDFTKLLPKVLRLRICVGEPLNLTRYVPVSDNLPALVLKLIRQITGAANGTSNTPPRHADFYRLWRSHARSKMARAGGHTSGRRRQGSEELSHSGDDGTP